MAVVRGIVVQQAWIPFACTFSPVYNAVDSFPSRSRDIRVQSRCQRLDKTRAVCGLSESGLARAWPRKVTEAASQAEREICCRRQVGGKNPVPAQI